MIAGETVRHGLRDAATTSRGRVPGRWRAPRPAPCSPAPRRSAPCWPAPTTRRWPPSAPTAPPRAGLPGRRRPARHLGRARRRPASRCGRRPAPAEEDAARRRRAWPPARDLADDLSGAARRTARATRRPRPGPPTLIERSAAATPPSGLAERALDRRPGGAATAPPDRPAAGPSSSRSPASSASASVSRRTASPTARPVGGALTRRPTRSAPLSRGAPPRGSRTPTGWWKGELDTNVTMDAEDLLLRQFLGILTPEQRHRRRRRGSAPSSATTARGPRSTAARPTCRPRSRRTSRCGWPATRPTRRTWRRPRAFVCEHGRHRARPGSSPGSGWPCSACGRGTTCPRCRPR